MAEKLELTLNLNNYDRPLVVSGKMAWIQLILNLLFTRKGSYPSCPEMGVDILSYEFKFDDIAKIKIQSELMEQINTYLPDIPISKAVIDVKRVANVNQPLLFLYLTFIDSETSVVAITEEYHVIDFAIAI